MSENRQSELFRKKALDHISSPDHLRDYLRVTNPGIWAVLAAMILLLLALLVWSMIGTLQIKVPVKVVVENHRAQVFALDAETLQEGMPLYVSGEETLLTRAGEDEYGRSVGEAQVALADGTYDGAVVTESIHPIAFLLESR